MMTIQAPALAARLAAASLCLAAAAPLAACSAGGSAGGPNKTVSASGAGALGSCSAYPGAKSCHYITVSATGAQAFHGTDTVPNRQACASALAANAAAHRGDVELSAPVFLTGPAAAFNLFLHRYHGPGGYSLASGSADVVFLIGGTQYSPTGSGAAITAVASADGSVAVTFSKLASGSDPSKIVSGRAQFTCKNA